MFGSIDAKQVTFIVHTFPKEETNPWNYAWLGWRVWEIQMRGQIFNRQPSVPYFPFSFPKRRGEPDFSQDQLWIFGEDINERNKVQKKNFYQFAPIKNISKIFFHKNTFSTFFPMWENKRTMKIIINWKKRKKTVNRRSPSVQYTSLWRVYI